MNFSEFKKMEKIELPEASEQLEVIKTLENNEKFSQEEPGRLISCKWIKIWRNFVKNSDSEHSKETTPHQIDNSMLVDEDGKLKKNLISGQDYEVLHFRVWEKLHEWYRGGPELKIEMAFDPVRSKFVPVIRKNHFFVFFENQKKVVEFSKYKSVNDLLIRCGEIFKFNPVLYRIRDFWNEKHGPILEGSNILCEYMLKEGQELIIEPCNLTMTPSTSSDLDLYVGKAQSELNVTDSLLEMAPVKQPSHKRSNSIDGTSDFSSLVPAKFIGCCGLQNLGNTCYMNAVFQCLLHTNELLYYLSDKRCEENIHNHTEQDGSKGLILTDFHILIKSITETDASYISPCDIKKAISLLAPQFAGTNMHDAHEFLCTFLRLIHNDLNKGTKSKNTEKKRDSVENAWNELIKEDDSIITKLFFGVQKSTIKCHTCGKETNVYDSIQSYELNLPNRESMTATFIFVPAKQTDPMTKMSIKILSGGTLEDFSESLSYEMKRPIVAVVAELSMTDRKSTWLPNYREPNKGKEIFVFEVRERNALHAVVWLCVRSGKFKGRNANIGPPYLLEIPGEATTQEQVQELCEKYFSYLWDTQQSQQRREDPDINEIRNSLKPFKHKWNKRLKVKLEKNFFSKTMRFKPTPDAPCVAKRNVKAILNTELIGPSSSFNWQLVKRDIKKSLKMPALCGIVPLSSCIKNSLAEETLDTGDGWCCGFCGNRGKATIKAEIVKFPPILVIHLKRFVQEGKRFTKNEIYVRYPMILNMSEYFETEEDVKYELYSVVEHSGGLSCGHYTAKCYVGASGPRKWFSFNDTLVNECTTTAVINANAYLLFYKRI